MPVSCQHSYHNHKATKCVTCTFSNKPPAAVMAIKRTDSLVVSLYILQRTVSYSAAIVAVGVQVVAPLTPRPVRLRNVESQLKEPPAIDIVFE